MEVFAQYCKDPIPPLSTCVELFRECQEIVASLELVVIPTTSFLYSFTQPIHWYPLEEGITLLELFARIYTSLAVILEAGLKVKRCIHVDIEFVPNYRGARHDVQKLLVVYPEELPPSALHNYFGYLPRDVTLINDEDLRRLGHVDLLIAGWLWQGHSRAEANEGLDDPQSSLFIDLMQFARWWFTHQNNDSIEVHF